MEKLLVIKIGGNVLDDEQALSRFLNQLQQLPDAKKILVHGGGKIASKIGEQLGITPNYIDGRRITDDATLNLVTMVYGGLVNKQLVAQLQSLKINAIGLSGADGNTIPATKRPVTKIDYGWAGDINAGQINTVFLQSILQQHVMPVFAPLTHDGMGNMLNTNADTIASSLAIALSCMYNVRLIYCFEKKGILLDVDDNSSVIHHMNNAYYQQLKLEGKLFAGILPKIDNALSACRSGVSEVLIGHADELLVNSGENVAGTLITN